MASKGISSGRTCCVNKINYLRTPMVIGTCLCGDTEAWERSRDKGPDSSIKEMREKVPGDCFRLDDPSPKLVFLSISGSAISKSEFDCPMSLSS